MEGVFVFWFELERWFLVHSVLWGGIANRFLCDKWIEYILYELEGTVSCVYTVYCEVGL